jgi:hypothetical protein
MHGFVSFTGAEWENFFASVAFIAGIVGFLALNIWFGRWTDRRKRRNGRTRPSWLGDDGTDIDTTPDLEMFDPDDDGGDADDD